MAKSFQITAEGTVVWTAVSTCPCNVCISVTSQRQGH